VLAAVLCVANPFWTLASPESGQPLFVYAGAGFRLPIEQAARVFTEREGMPVELTFAGGGCLLAQAEIASRGDVIIPGEIHYLRKARERGLVEEVVPLAYLQPVIAVPEGNPAAIGDLVDLGRPGLRIGLGDPQSVAVGLAAERWFAGVLTEAERKSLLANVRTRAINVNELGGQLALGALDAAIVWSATVPLFPGLTAVVPASSAEYRTVITGAVLGCSRKPSHARGFLAFLAGPEGARIFRDFGFEPLASDPGGEEGR
jgi:molybdate transport system substrate-binding protein